MRIKYDKTTWVDNETPVNANNLNKIENALETLYNLSLSPSDFNTNSQIKPTVNDGEITLSFDGFVLRETREKPEQTESNGTAGDFYLDQENNKFYLCIRNNFWIKLDYLYFNREGDLDSVPKLT